MSRAPFQVLVLPYVTTDDRSVRYALLRREPTTGGYWQGVAGGGEDNETPLQAAQRETLEEAGIQSSNGWIELDSMSMVPVVQVCGFAWGEDVLVIPNHCFGVAVTNERLVLSEEHTEYRWMTYEEAMDSLHWEDNRTALWELNHRLVNSASRRL